MTESQSSSDFCFSCSFVNFDDILIIMNANKRQSIRQLKQRIFKELTNMDLACSDSANAETISEDIISLASNDTGISIKGKIVTIGHN